jgi:histidyl-tRNA synthetase
MFRQERPQAGRLRQFHQFGAEALGSNSPLLDAEMIEIAFLILKQLGLKDLVVKINTLGTAECREIYKNELKNFLSAKKEKLSDESKVRLEKNVLRILDSKSEADQEILKDAPSLLEFLDQSSKNDFEVVTKYLGKLNIPFEVDSKLVRGLDYYTKTTFEIISNKVGAQNSLCGGGRYDLLVEQLGGKPTCGVGFAAGMERILLACDNENSLDIKQRCVDIFIVRLNKELELKIAELASFFRQNNLIIEYDYLSRSVKAQMREANKLFSKFVLFVGGEEFDRGQLVLKNLSDGSQTNFSLNNLSEIISRVK